MLESLQQISEIVVPKPNMLVKNRATGEYGKIGYFKLMSGEATEIPIRLESGKTERLSYFVFPRNYDIIDPEDSEYRNYQIVKGIEANIVDLEKELHNINVTLRSDKDSLSTLSGNLKLAMSTRIGDLEIEQDNLQKKIRKLKLRIKRIG